MMKLLRKIALLIVCTTGFSICANAQFKEQAFTQNYNDVNDTTMADSTASMFSIKQFFRGVAHKDSLKVGTLFAGSTVFIGCEQIYNRDYWKLPVIYGGLGATIGLGIHYRKDFNSTGSKNSKNLSTIMFAGAAAIYWGTLLDGVACFDKGRYPQPGKATLYSALVPGLGQVYNGDYWKIPIYWGGLIVSTHLYSVNNTNYKRYKRIHNEATTSENYEGSISAETALYYRNVFRRYRDYSMVAMLGFYLLQVIDANVFAYMHDFDVGDDLSMNISPTIISPDNSYAFGPTQNSFGVSIGLKF